MAALNFLEDLPQGIARALYSKPELVIFDEATSSLDMRNERAIHETILSLRNRMTLVIIAHRLSAVEGCDHIIWMGKGRVRMAGKTAEVLPVYTRFLQAQHVSDVEQE